MENNPDKEISRKLQGMELPYNPKAWEQMDAILEENRRRRGFFWWFATGVAACILIGAGTLGYFHFNTGSADSHSMAQKLKEVNPTNKPSNASEDYKENNIVSSNAKPANENIEARKPAIANQAIGNPVNSKSGKNENLIAAENRLALNTGRNSDKSAAEKSPKWNATDNPKGQRTGGPLTGNIPVSQNSVSDGHTASDGAISSGEAITGNISQPAAAIAVSEIAGMNPNALPSLNKNADDDMKKRGDDNVNLKKLKKQVFNYSAGIAANETGTTLGSQKGATGLNVFAPLPSYMLGLTQEFMFWKRFAITNGFMFSQTSFKVYNPKTGYTETPVNYTSKITEFNIPIGLKAYVVSKPKFRFYIGAGVINHIKLKETFAYTFQNNNNVTGISNPLLPGQTNFNGGGQTYFPNSAYSTLQGSYSSTSDFGINHAKRYYASFYANAGVEFIVKKKLVFFAEPLFFNSLEKVGIQDKTKFNIGLSEGLRLRFK